MNWTWATVVLIFGVVWTGIYMMARPALRSRFPDFYGRIEPLEVLIWRKSRTILVARLVTFITWLIAIHDAVTPALLSVDWTPIIPERYRGGYLIGTMAMGPIFEFLRTITDRSIQAKEADASA